MKSEDKQHPLNEPSETDQPFAGVDLRRINRELHAISDCNRMLICAEDEQTLLQDICRIVCETAGYRMAWVGYVEYDEAKTVRPVAWGGFEKGYLANARITWADTEFGRGPTGTAVRTGEVVYIHDFITDPRIAPWRESVLQRGYRSGIALPLKDDRGHVFGVLNIYSTESNVLTQDEIRFLSELANNLAFGITVLRNKVTHKKAEEALRESEEKYRLIAENASDVIWAADLDMNLTYVSPSVERLQGWTKEEAKTLTLERIMPPDSIEMVKNMFSEGVDRIRRGELDPVQSRMAEIEVYRKDGTTFWAEVAARFVRDEEGNIKSIVGVSRDITQRRKAEEALRISETTLKSVFFAAPVGIVITDMNRVPTWANETMVSIMGYTTEELKDTGTKIFYETEEEYARVGSIIQQEIKKDGITIIDTKWIIKNGEVKDIHLRGAAIDSKNMGTGLVFTVLDITSQKRAEKAVLESEEKYRNVVENSFFGFYIIKNGLFRYVNKRLCEILGYTYEEMVDKMSPLDPVYPDDKELMSKNIQKRVLGEVDRIDYEFRAVRKDGKIVTLRVIGTAIMYEGERVASGSILDVTKEKSLEAKLLQFQKMEALGTLAGGIAHDFNNILTALMGYGTLLQMKMKEEDPLRTYVDQILSASDKASQLTQGLLAFSRQQPIVLDHVNIDGLIRGTGKLLKRLLTDDIELKTFLAAGGIDVIADASQIDRILFNLATNARDAMLQGGVLTIETKAVELDEGFRYIHGYGEPGAYVLLSVSDTGTGMDKTTQEHIFEPFFTTKELGKGTGLGLSTIYGVVKQHNGYITVYSEPGIGTTFHIYFPAVAGVGREESRVHFSAQEGGDETILVAEDNEAVRVLISKILTQYGYKTIEVTNGMDAVERFKAAEDIDLLILDSVMPVMNGREAYNEICRIKPDVRVIFTSGYTREVFIDKGIENETFNFIQKPISLNALLQKVREVLNNPAVK